MEIIEIELRGDCVLKLIQELFDDGDVDTLVSILIESILATIFSAGPSLILIADIK